MTARSKNGHPNEGEELLGTIQGTELMASTTITSLTGEHQVDRKIKNVSYATRR